MRTVYKIISEVSSGTATHTGKIKSSMRIAKALQKAIDSGDAVQFTFEDGTQGTLSPSIAKMALAKYNKLTPFEQAEAAAYMRKSYKNFLAAIKN